MRIAVVVPFLDEARYLPELLASVAGQSRPPDELVLIDDGSRDGSGDLAERFAAQHRYARALRRPARPRGRDRLGEAAELRAFQWGAAQLDPGWEVLAKLDADLQLPPGVLEQVEAAMRGDPSLGVTGPFLWVRDQNGELRRERCPDYHVRGATKFYRRACWEQIAPLPAILGWDTIDEVAARRHGWRTASFSMSDSYPLHRRPVGAVDGRLHAFWRWGACAYAIGDHPLWLAAGTGRRVCRRPWLLGGLAYLGGWLGASLRRAPRAAPALRARVRREQLTRLRLLG